MESAKNYILGNWTGIMESLKAKDKSLQCSAEGHVSHIYADRMSSRPLGWSRTGADKMSRLRIYRQNKGNMLELVRYQKQEIPMVAGAEAVSYTHLHTFTPLTTIMSSLLPIGLCIRICVRPHEQGFLVR